MAALSPMAARVSRMLAAEASDDKNAGAPPSDTPAPYVFLTCSRTCRSYFTGFSLTGSPSGPSYTRPQPVSTETSSTKKSRML